MAVTVPSKFWQLSATAADNRPGIDNQREPRIRWLHRCTRTPLRTLQTQLVRIFSTPGRSRPRDPVPAWLTVRQIRASNY